jgi:hypothetical protein
MEGLLEFSLAYGGTVFNFSSVEGHIRLWQMFCWMFLIVIITLKSKDVSNKLFIENILQSMEQHCGVQLLRS